MRASSEQIVRRRSVPRGSALVEAALVLPLFLLLTFGIIEFSRVFYVQLTLQGAVREAARFTVTGNTLPDPDDPDQHLSRIESIIAKIHQISESIGVQPDDIRVLGPSGEGDPGGPGDLVTIVVDYDVQLLTPMIRRVFPGGAYHCTVSMIARNEPFPTS